MDYYSLPGTLGIIIILAALDWGLMTAIRKRGGRLSWKGIVSPSQTLTLLLGLRRLPEILGKRIRQRSIPRPWSASKRWPGQAARARALIDRCRAWLRKWSPALCLAACGLGLTGQVCLFAMGDLRGGIAFLLAGGLVWLAAGPGLSLPAVVEAEPRPVAPRRTGSRFPRAFAFLFSFQLALAAVFLAGRRVPSDDHWDILIVWAAACLVYLAVFSSLARRIRWAAILETWKDWLPFALLTLLAAALRFYRLGQLPGIMENDEGLLGEQTVWVLNGWSKDMFAIHGSFGTLYYFLEAIPVMIFGRTAFALRLIPALLGTLAVPLLGWLGARLFDVRTAFVACALLATSHVEIHYSRVAPTTSSMDQVFLLIFILSLYEGLTRRHQGWWAAAGLIMGLGLYFYVGLRVMEILCLTVLVGVLIIKRELIRANLSGLAICAGGFLVAAGPMLVYAFNRPEIFDARLDQRSIFSTGWLQNEIAVHGRNLWEILGRQVSDSLLMFNYHWAGWFYESTVPILGWVGGLLLWFGLLLCLTHLNRLPVLMVNAWFWVVLGCGQILLILPANSAYRTMTLMPAVCLTMALMIGVLAAKAREAASRTFSKSAKWESRAHRVVSILIMVVIILEAGWSVRYYFRSWANAFTYGETISRTASLMGEFIGSQSRSTKIYLARSPDYRNGEWPAVNYLAGSNGFILISAPLSENVQPPQPGQRTVVVGPAQLQEEFERLRGRYPGGRVEAHGWGGRTYFWAYVMEELTPNSEMTSP